MLLLPPFKNYIVASMLELPVSKNDELNEAHIPLAAAFRAQINPIPVTPVPSLQSLFPLEWGSTEWTTPMTLDENAQN